MRWWAQKRKKLFVDAQQMLDTMIRERWLQVRAVYGIFPANSIGDTIEVYQPTAPESRVVVERLEMLRQQLKKAPGKPNQSLADLILPREQNRLDYIGAFAVTAGLGIEQHVARYEAEDDDYSAILLKALADRLAEAATEWLHAKVRRECWGYEAAEALSNDELIEEKYRGIRPAPGYPACPDHTEKAKLWRLLDATTHTGITLTESYAMYPAASVSGWYFAHPEAKYFGLVGHIAEDQLEDYARRKTWISPSEALAYTGDGVVGGCDHRSYVSKATRRSAARAAGRLLLCLTAAPPSTEASPA